MKTLLILRHAKSSWGNLEQSDHERPLNKRGKRDAPRMGQLLRAEGLVPDLIVSSTAKRAKTTAMAVGDAAGYENEIVLTRSFYHAPPSIYLDYLSEMDEDGEIVMVVGHNPGMSYLVERLTGVSDPFPTACLAAVRLSIDRWAEVERDIEGELINLWKPRELTI